MKDLDKAIKLLMIKEPFYGSFIISMKKIATTKIPAIAGVRLSGMNIELLIHPELWDELPMNIKVGVLKHEMEHIVFQHILMRDTMPDARIANIAADIVCNSYIPIVDLPEGVITIESSQFSGVFTNNDRWNGAQYYYNKLSKIKQDSYQGANNPSALRDLLEGITPIPINYFEVVDFIDGSDELSQATKEMIKTQIDSLLKNAINAVGMGNLPGEIEAYIKDLLVPITPHFNWKAYMRTFAERGFKTYVSRTKKRHSKRFPDFPGTKIKKHKSMLVAVDTSGSVSDLELNEFFNEIFHIWKTGCEIDILEIDTELRGPIPYKGKWDGRVYGRGGTDFTPGVTFYNTHYHEYSALIYFTDGEGYCSTPAIDRTNILWVLTPYGNQYDKTLPGRVIKMNKIEIK